VRGERKPEKPRDGLVKNTGRDKGTLCPTLSEVYDGSQVGEESLNWLKEKVAYFHEGTKESKKGYTEVGNAHRGGVLDMAKKGHVLMSLHWVRSRTRAAQKRRRGAKNPSSKWQEK